MAATTFIAATTGAVSNRELNLNGYEFALLSASNLATTETVTIELDGQTVGQLVATAATPDTAVPQFRNATRIEGGAVYTIDKAATAGSCAVTVSFGPAI